MLVVSVGSLGQNALRPAVFPSTSIRSGVFGLSDSRSKPPDIGTVKSAFISRVLRPALLERQGAAPRF